MPDRYIHVRNWPRFQHPDTLRAKTPGVGGLPWIRDFTSKLRDEEWMGSSFALRGLLESICLQYGVTRGRGLIDSTTSLTRLLGQRVLRSQLDALNHAGFIEFSASKWRATDLQDARADTEGDTEKPLPTRSVGINDSTNLKCKNCGEPIKPRQVCPNCGVNPRAAGNNPRALVQLDKEQAHLELLREATQIAANWNGKDSLAFDEELDELQQALQAQLSFSEREDLWEKAFKQ